MGFTKPNFPPIDPEEFLRRPLMDRMKYLALWWVENGFGTPKVIHTVYVFKLLFFFILGGVVVATTTSHLVFWDVASWWNQPVVYQKVILWTVFLEALNVAGSWGPLVGKFKPMTGGVRFWAKLGTIRQRPWKWVPFTAGDRRTVLDVVLYVLLLASLVVAVVPAGVITPTLAAALPTNTTGLVDPVLLIAPVVLLVLVGLRDKTIFLGARGEQYLPALFFFAVLPFADMIIALKLLIVVVWVGAGASKFGKHFANVVPPMVSNSPAMPFKWLKRAHYRDYPTDIRPSRIGDLMAHVGGTTVEIILPLVLLFSTNRVITLLAVAGMVIFHLFIVSTFPLAVPLEWNIVFAYATIFLFAGFPAGAGYGVTDMSSPWLTAVVVIGLLFFPILGNLRPDLVSFLPSMRQYAGNWASAVWAFAPGAERKLNSVVGSVPIQVDQLAAMGYDPAVAEVTMQQTLAWRTMHSQGRGLLSLLLKHLPDVDQRTVREAEFLCNSLIGFNFGDGHLHNEDMINAVQAQARFEPGEVLIVWVESQSVHHDYQEYKVIDPALGVIERGTWKVADAVNEQPWLPNGPIPTNVTWTRRAEHGAGI
ncbi:MAG: hypothetical protein QOD04_4199 [Pseudonocardiales bacterium]|jgi:hypothetical protein|nr:hypothetical protein [Pseudonocardiales bacterium]MDT7664643.1 hypothetical protein [Pseudonocardiales bacterium]MDT7671268.1 hypothetical protein [Pseudonocardiales bacterium]MDT7692116.1 hypothetical protein [Pseudonocardiales bacterium]